MDDLAGLDWSSTAKPNDQGALSTGNQPSPLYPSLRPTPSPQISGRNTPLSSQASGFTTSKPATSKPAVDSFSNLVHFGGNKNNANLSLRERQEQLEAEKRKKEEDRRKQMQSQYGGGQFWDTLGQSSGSASRTASPSVLPASNGTGAQNGAQRDDDEDLFAAFKRDTKVDNSSYYPPPIQPQSGKSTPLSAAKVDLTNPTAWSQPSVTSGGGFGDDDDPFGLNQLKSAALKQKGPATVDEDADFLGDLGKPVEEVRRKVEASHPEPEPGKPIEDSESESEPEPPSRPRGDDPFDKAVAELVDMGFTAENARRGLTESGAGLNVQAAVGWLLDDAHRTAREKQKTGRDPRVEHGRDRESAARSRDRAGPAWMKDDRPDVPPRRDNTSPESGGDFSQMAAAMGSSFLKTANSLWKTGQKQVQKAVAEFNHEEGDPSQPKWMRTAHEDRTRPQEKASKRSTDEAMMLESGSRPDRHPPRASHQSPARPSWSEKPRDSSPALPTRPSHGSSAAPKWQQSAQLSRDSRAGLNKQAAEEESTQHYVSKNRRKNVAPQPRPPAESEPDLLFNSTIPAPSKGRPQQSTRASPGLNTDVRKPSSRTATPRPPKPTRQIPAVSPAVIQASNKYRSEGTAHFKRGDFDAAHTSYSNSLRGVPQTHPLCIVLLTNRSLTALKTGDPKQAVTDADAAISIIGPSFGEGEKIELGDGEQRDMKDLYGKALSRKAEALEQMEKWTDAGDVWQLSVESGVGGATAIAGRQRCQKALAPRPKPTPKPATASRPRPKPSALSDLGPPKDSEAVQRLREANRAAEQADDEKFALGEKVDARISAWRDGKRDNLRALLGSLDQVLWEGSGWKKVGLHELVVANRVKIHYMKAIAKTHPDKLPQGANTEVKLIAGLVFATLNEAWDKFKAENGL